MSLSVVIIGLGQIGMGYDLGLPADSYVMTHARAFQNHPDFILLGGVDVDAKRRSVFEREYGCKAFANIDSALKILLPDVVVISVPTELHLNAVKSVFSGCSPKAILCEKPLAYELADARQINSICKEHQCQLFVNYIRRADPGVLEVKTRLEKGLISHPVKGIAWYSKGLFNNGSHFVDLLTFWLGPIQSFSILRNGRKWGGIDPEPDFLMNFVRGTVYFMAAQEENFSHYSVELLAPSGRLRYERGGEHIAWQSAVKNSLLPEYTSLSMEEEVIPNDLLQIQKYVTNQLAMSMKGQYGGICSGDEALQNLEYLSQLKEI